MLNLQHRIDLLVQLGKYIRDNNPEWREAKQRAAAANPWFISQFIDLAASNISDRFLMEPVLIGIAEKYQIPGERQDPKTIGIVMAGNIPLVGFHDWLCVFLSGHNALIKFSSKDNILLKHLLGKLYDWEITVQNTTGYAEMLKGCDAYIATGSDNSSRYFDYYFSRYPNIIRRNRTSVAILDGSESDTELWALADDSLLFFGLGCRNVTKLYVPRDYDFIPLLTAFRKYQYYIDQHKYKNNFDYQLAIHLLNNRFYMSNETVLLSENSSIFAPISQINYEYYDDHRSVLNELSNNKSIQCIVGHGHTDFGQAQRPGFEDYPDGVNTMAFLQSL